MPIYEYIEYGKSLKQNENRIDFFKVHQHSAW